VEEDNALRRMADSELEAQMGQLAKSQRSRELRAKFMTATTELVMQNRVKRQLMNRFFVFSPISKGRGYWDSLCMVLLLYTALMTPYQISFLGDVWDMQNISKWPVNFAIDRLIDLVFSLDIIVNFRSAWVISSGELYFDRNEAAANYTKFWFWVDFFSVLPYEFLSILPGMKDAGDGNTGGSSMRMPKLLRLLRLAKITKVS
jgi:potassium voltage-gated channel Eag-related subfamily H protein 8